jgi:hypothetical protein
MGKAELGTLCLRREVCEGEVEDIKTEVIPQVEACVTGVEDAAL